MDLVRQTRVVVVILRQCVQLAAQPGQQPSTGGTSPTTEAGGRDTEDQEDAGLVPARPNPVAAVPNVVAPVEDGSGLIHGPGLAAAAGGSGVSQAPLVLPFAGVSGVPVAGNATRVATLDVILLGRVSALSGMASQAPNGAFSMGAESFFPHDFNELLLITSLWALAAVALPGVVGLVILTVVGVRIQYGRLTGDSHREHRAFRDSPIPRAVKRWMSAR